MSSTKTRRTALIAGAAAVAAAAGITLGAMPASAGGGAGAGAGAAGSTHKSAVGGSHGAAPVSGSSHGGDGKATYFAGSMNGANEVPVAGGPAVGDTNGQALAFMRIKGNEVSFAFKFRGITPPTAAHIHQGGRGKNGDIKIPFFAKQVKPGKHTVSGSIVVKDEQLLDKLRSDPRGFYFNLHTGQFPGGAVRGQVNKLTSRINMDKALRQNFRASVIRGQQIYKCAKQPGGGYAFTQDNVRAVLQGGILHSFKQAGPAGPPQWIAPDRSAVTGKLINKFPNGERNIAELDLAASQSGKKRGLFKGIDEILRLNTVGGVAPGGSCDPQKRLRVAVSYGADYVFVNGR
jgi:hypothetical protein